jgi:PAS domain S-box-containing protein
MPRHAARSLASRLWGTGRPEPLERLLRLAAAVFDAPSVTASRAVPGGSVEWAEIGFSPPSTETERAALQALHRRVAESMGPLVILDLATDPRANAALAARGYAACLAIRLGNSAAGEGAGALLVLDTRSRQWSPQEISLLEDLAALVSTGEAVAARPTRRGKLSLGESVRRSGDLFQRLIENATDIIHVLDEQGRILYMSPSIERVLGYAPAEMVGRVAEDFVHPEDLPFASMAFEHDLQHASPPRHMELRLRHKDGSWRTLEVIGSIIEDASGAKLGIVNSRDLTERVRSESALRQTEERYRNLFEQSADAIFMSTPSGRILEANPAFRELFGWTREELRRVNALQGYVDPEDRGRFQRALESRGFVRDYEMRLRKRDGTELTCLVSGTLVREEDGTVAAYHGIVRDITDRKRAEDNLRQQAFLFDTLLEGVLITDPQGRITHWNRAAEQIFGYSRDEVLGQSPAIFHHPSLQGRREPEILEALRRDGRWSGEIPFVRKDGSEGVSEAVVVVQYDSEGRVVANVGVNRDITERKRAEEERLRLLVSERAARATAEAAEQRAQLLAEVSELFATSLDPTVTLKHLGRLVVPRFADSCLIYRLDEAGRVQRLDPVHAEPSKEALLHEQLHRYPPQLHPLIPIVARVLESGSSEVIEDVTTELLKARPDDVAHTSIASELALRSLLVVPLASRGRTLGAISLGASRPGRSFGADEVAVIEEVARRAALAIDNALLYHRAQQEVRAREHVLRVVSHDLRSPLAAIVLNASSVLESQAVQVEPLTRELSQSVLLSAGQMNRLIDDLIDFARIEAGHLPLERFPQEVGPLVRTAVAMMQSLAAKKSLELSTEIPDDLPIVPLQGDRIMQVFSNLLGNAIKFTPAGGAIVTRAIRQGEEICFSVADTGLGISEEQLPHLFNLFWQASPGSRSGAGLGLAIAKGIVEAHGGRIWVESTVSAGSTFYFTLPLPDG